MDKMETFDKLKESGIAAVMRLSSKERVHKAIDALSAGGVKAIEVTMSTPNAVEIIDEITDDLDDSFLVGAGTLLDEGTTREVIQAGAQFVVSPILKPEIVETAHRYDTLVAPGAFSPSEIFSAWEMGADVVKVFPATRLGPKYLSKIHGPLPQIKLTPTGGVCLDNAADYIKNGAEFLGAGSALLDKEMLANDDWDGITERAKNFKEIISKARKQK